MARTSNQESIFGENFKYVLVLTALAWMVYTLPSVQLALAEGTANSFANLSAAGMASSSNQFGHFMDKGRGPDRGMPNATGSPMMAGNPQKPPSSEMRPNKELSPQQVVTLLFKLGYISQDKLDAARVAVDHYDAGTSTPPLPCITVSTTTLQASSTQPSPCREIDRDHMPRLGTTTDMRMMKIQGDRR